MADKFLQIHGLVVLVFTLCSVCIHLLLQPHAWSSDAHCTSSSSPLTLHVLRKKGGVQAKQRPGEPGVWRHRRLAASLSPPWPVAANRRVTASVTPTTILSTRILPLQNPVSLNSYFDNSMRLSIQSTPVEKAMHRAQLLLKIRQPNAKTLLPRAVATPDLTGMRTSSRPKGFGV
jgi:hypothetical protein